nr:hypothetical protein [Tanacetum cinerariifolium]
MEHATKQQLLKHSAKPFDQAARVKFDQKEILFQMIRENNFYENHLTLQALYDAFVQSLILDEDDMEKAKTVELLTQKKRIHDDKDQDPPVGPDQEKTVFEAVDTDMTLNQGDDIGNTDEQPDVEAVIKDDWFKKSPRPLTPDLNGTKAKQLTMNRAGSIHRKYTASTTKTKVAKYELEGIKDMVPKLWSPIKVAFGHIRDAFSVIDLHYRFTHSRLVSRAKVIENQIKCLYLDYNRFQTLHSYKDTVMSDSEDSTVTYTEFMPSEDDVLPAEEQSLPAAVLPTTDSPRYIPESDSEEDDEDPEEDLADYPTDREYDNEDEEEESSGDDADDKEEDEDEDEEEEEEHLASIDSIPPPPVHRTTTRISIPA